MYQYGLCKEKQYAPSYMHMVLLWFLRSYAWSYFWIHMSFYAYILQGCSLITGTTRLPWDSWIILKYMGKFYGYETALTQNCLLTPYGDIALGQHWFRWWLDAISRWCGYMASTWEQFCIMSFKMIILITATSPRASELKQLRANRVRKIIC